MKAKGKKKTSPGQMRLPWDSWEVVNSEVREWPKSLYSLIAMTPR